MSQETQETQELRGHKCRGESIMSNKTDLGNTLKLGYFKRLGTKITFTFLILSVIMITSLSTLLYGISSSIISKNMAEKAASIAKGALEYIDVKEFQQLKTVEDEKKASYINMRESLSKVRKISGSKYVYTMRKTDDGKFMYVVDGSDEEGLSHIGDLDKSSVGYDVAYSGKVFTDTKMRNEGQWGIVISSYYPIKDNDTVIGFIGVDYDVENMYKGLQRLKTLAVFIAFGASFIIAICGRMMALYITRPIIKIVGIANKVSNNDLQVEALTVKDHTELGILSASFNKMIENIKNVLLSIQNSSEELAAASHIIARSAEETGASSESIATNVGEIAAGSSDQAEEATRGYELANDLSKKVHEISDRLHLANTNTTIMKEKNELGSTSISNLEKSFGQYSNLALNIADKVEGLSAASASINNILQTITVIAEQTNLLALNAAIEAARAGEHGRGFAVVSEEVRKLAEQAALSAKEIQQIVNEVSYSIADISKATYESKTLISSVKTAIETSREALNGINVTVNDTVNEIKYLDKDIKEIDHLRINVLSSVESIASIAQHSAAATEEISASAEEQSKAMEEIVASVERLDNMINNVVSSIKQYKF